MDEKSILAQYADLFPTHTLRVENFIDDLLQLKKKKNSQKLLEYWRNLGDEGNMENILSMTSKQDHDKIKILIYSMAEFLEEKDYVELKKRLDINGHILEFVFAIFAKPKPNLDIIRYFITVARNPRHYSPQMVKWFYEHVSPLIKEDNELSNQFLENCTTAVQRWVVTNKHSQQPKNKKSIDPILYDLIDKVCIPEGLL